jgi:hypothetical protein
MNRRHKAPEAGVEYPPTSVERRCTRERLQD